MIFNRGATGSPIGVPSIQVTIELHIDDDLVPRSGPSYRRDPARCGFEGETRSSLEIEDIPLSSLEQSSIIGHTLTY